MCGNVYTSQVAKVLLSIVSKAESIKKMTGVEVKDIEVYFKQIKAKEE